MSTTRGSYRSIKDSEVQAGTGKSWLEWISLLDEINVHSMSLKAIIDYLIEAQGVMRIWAQVIAVYYKWRI